MEKLYVVNSPKSENHGKLVRILETAKNGKSVKCQKRNGKKFYMDKECLDPAIIDNIILNLTWEEILGTGIRRKIMKFFLERSARNLKFDIEE